MSENTISNSPSRSDTLPYDVDDKIPSQLSHLNKAAIGTPQFWLVCMVLVVVAVAGMYLYEREQKDNQNKKGTEIQNEDLELNEANQSNQEQVDVGEQLASQFGFEENSQMKGSQIDRQQ